jgi:hypothetical protein
VNTAEEPVLRKKLRRKEMFAFLEKLALTVIAIEACGASHHCARLLQSFGHSACDRGSAGHVRRPSSGQGRGRGRGQANPRIHYLPDRRSDTGS